MKKRLYFCLLTVAVLALLGGCAPKTDFHPPRGTDWLEAWLAAEEERAESLTLGELAESFDWIVETEIVDISPLQETSVKLPNGETRVAAFRDYTLEIRASFPSSETGRLLLRAAETYTGSRGELATLWRQTGQDGAALKTGQTLWLYGSKLALDTEPFAGLPQDGLIIAVDDFDRLLPCRDVARVAQPDGTPTGQTHTGQTT